ncbi:P-loop containing nucleoside triphosphate hydrolase protein [Blakeslea trispora]|nr:P-loop containing nucleoside triphosphate hydrolase protein [Blakeslea trispora]
MRQNSDMEQDTVMSNYMDTRVEVESVLDAYFPQWRSYSSCVTFVQSIFNDPSNRKTTNKQWTDKYRPNQVNGLLGARHNFTYLKDWLHQMKVEPLSAPQLDSDQKQHKGKRGKKKKKLNMDNYRHEEDGGEGMDLMRSLSLHEDDIDDDDFVVNPTTQKKRLKKEPMRSNILLLVGEHGVGKTATVYTAAEQMGYEVFEINSGSRRSGKDIMSMVGEMTKSHLVAFGAAPPASAHSLFIERPKPIPVNKRKKLNPTLSTTLSAKHDSKVTLKSFLRKKEAIASLPVSSSSSVPTTKQSLILLEEVDLLFEEDKGFWTSVIELAQKSKRPIIMTCNNLDQIPLDNLCLQIILDIKPPPDNELLPYLWLVCYREGFQVDPIDLVCLIGLLGRDIRKLLQTLEMFVGQAIFGNYLGIHQDMDQVKMKLRCVPSETGIDTYRLACEYQDMNSISEEQDNDEGLECIAKALENDCFIDSWLQDKENAIEEIEDIEKDQINGYTYLKLDSSTESDDLLRIRELETNTTILNNQMPQSEAWRQLVSDENSHWIDLCSARASLAEDYRDLLERVLPATIDDQMLMMEYIPHIQMMMASESPKENHRIRATRSKRKKTHLSLSEEAIESLNQNKPIIDKTAYIIQYLQSLKMIHRQ